MKLNVGSDRVSRIAKAVRDAGGRAYLVGGVVLDAVMGRGGAQPPLSPSSHEVTSIFLAILSSCPMPQ